MTAEILMINIADLKDPNDSDGRTYKEVNASITHKFHIGALVEIKNGCRLFVVKHTRDCDMTPLYSLAPNMEGLEFNNMFGWSHGYGEDGMILVDALAELARIAQEDGDYE